MSVSQRELAATSAAMPTFAPTTKGPNQLWLTDITEHPTGQGKVYLCAIKDEWLNRIVGYSISDRRKSRIAVDALNMPSAAAARSPAASCTPTEASQLRSRKFLAALRRHELAGSMGQVASADDNAAMGSSFALLQRSVQDRHRWATRHELRLAIITWIERTYHRRRRQASLGRLPPSNTRPS